MGRIPAILAILLIIPLTVWAVFQNHDWRRAAFGRRANIVIDLAQPGGEIRATLWQNFAQGGEEPKNMLAPIVNQIRALKPQLIRIDHIFDYYVKINGPNNYDFSALDQVVETILQTGAKPMLVLSYMPPNLAQESNLTAPPNNWADWQRLVAATIARYSGYRGYNINNVYYEVWNEPDLFGRWHYGKKPNYLTLYYHTVKAAQSVTQTQPFKIGGPATTGFYPNWLKALFKFGQKNNLRIDFVSWHRYSKSIEDYQEDLEKLNRILTDYPEYFGVERLITEVGPDSENSPWYDNKLGAAHSLALTTRLLGRVHRLFTFELKDGPNPEGKKYWGRWGLITHEQAGLVAKPRYYAYLFLNQLVGRRLPLEGEGSWVSALAAQDGPITRVLLVNYDPRNRHYEAPPITLKNLTPGAYVYRVKYFQGREMTVRENYPSNNLTKKVILPPNSAALLEFRRLGPSE